MLVLTRKVGTKILIGDDIVITITRIGVNAVKVGVQCPKEIPVMRSELIKKGESENADVS